MAIAMRFPLAVAAVALLSGVCPCAASPDAVWGTGLCFQATEPGLEGYWEYCYHIEWDTTEYGGSGLSHSTIYLALAECVCACDDGYFAPHTRRIYAHAIRVASGFESVGPLAHHADASYAVRVPRAGALPAAAFPPSLARVLFG
jgi:hypothetical protein